MSKPVILTGLRANNDLHIGNYFGALLPLIDMAKQKSDEYEVHLFVPDLHSFTTPIDHKQLQAQIMHNLRLFVAAGMPLDNPNVHIYRQSYIPAHSELTVILNSFTGMGQMERMTQFKDKSGISKNDIEKMFQVFEEEKKEVDSSYKQQPGDIIITKNDGKKYLVKTEGSSNEVGVSVGLFDYPVLMAADILLYGVKYVPVGDDQTQHLEFTRDIAERMNSKFGQLFTVPEPVAKQHEFFGKEQGLRIKDLQDPTKKMSKSDETGKGIIFLGDSPDEAAKKIMSATTDSVGAVHLDYENQPGISNLLQLHALLSDETLEKVAERHDGQQSYGELKKEVAEQMREFLTNFRQRLAEVDDAKLMHKLESDEFAMNERANATLERVQRAVGLRPSKSKDDSRAGARRKPHKISFDHFAKVDVRVGTVTQTEKLEGSDKLIKLHVDLGSETRQILTGMQEFYAPEDFVGKQVPVLVNLAERTMMGELSQGMLLALQGEEGPVFLTPDKPLANGSPLE